MSAQDPHDQHLDPSATAATPPATPSVRDLLASCAAARTVSTPPTDAPRPPAAQGRPPAAETRRRHAA